MENLIKQFPDATHKRKRAVEDVNFENDFPSYFRSYDFKILCVVMGLLFIIVLAGVMGVMKLLGEFIDSQPLAVGCLLLTVFVIVFVCRWIVMRKK